MFSIDTISCREFFPPDPGRVIIPAVIILIHYNQSIADNFFLSDIDCSFSFKLVTTGNTVLAGSKIRDINRIPFKEQIS